MSRIVVRNEEKVQLMSFVQDKCPLCGATKDHVRVVEERQVLGEDDYKLPKLVVLETEQSPRGAISWSNKVGAWVCEQGIHPSWSNFQGWNDIRGKLYVVYPVDAKIAIVGNRLERGEGFYNEKFVQASQDRGWVLMADQQPIKIEPFVRDTYHRACVAEKVIEAGPEKIGTQGHLEVCRISNSHRSWGDGELDKLGRHVRHCSLSCGETKLFLNHKVSPYNTEEFDKKAEVLTAKVLSGENVEVSPIPEIETFRRNGMIYCFVSVFLKVWVISSDHPEQDMCLEKGVYLFVHPVPQDGRDD